MCINIESVMNIMEVFLKNKKKILLYRASKIVLVIPLLALLVFQSLSSERLVLRYSQEGAFKLLLEKDAETTPLNCLEDSCCSKSSQIFQDNCHAGIVRKTAEPMMCCSELPFGGGATQASKITLTQIAFINLSIYNEKIKYNSNPNSIISTASLVFSHDPPGYVKTTVLRL